VKGSVIKALGASVPLPGRLRRRRGQAREADARPPADPLDEQISSLLESVELESREPSPAAHPPGNGWTSPSPVFDAPEQKPEASVVAGPTEAPPTPARTPPRGRFRFLRDREFREHVYNVVAGATLGAVVGLVVAHVLR
jgi:hypothetical protein